MRLQFVSDLHLNLRPKETFETMLTPKAPILALLGDIAPIRDPNLRQFLEWCHSRWETVLYIPGNEELIHRDYSIEVALKNLKVICARFPNVHVLYGDSFISEDGIVVLGCTFWSCIPTVPKAHRTRHRTDLNWVIEQTKLHSKPIVVLSYYGPAMWVQNEERIEQPDSVLTVPELDLLLRAPIISWIFGHVHAYIEYTKLWNNASGEKHSVLLLCNGLGERVEEERPYAYRDDAVIALRPELYKV
jgi:hypothetical protein